MADFSTALVGVAGVLVGGGVQFAATSINERWKHRTKTRTDAYEAFVRAMSKISLLNGQLARSGQPPTPEQTRLMQEYQSDFADAKVRIALYGSPEVLTSLGRFTHGHAHLSSNEDFEAYIDFVETMRKDSFAKDYAAFRTDLDNLMLRGMML